MIEVNATITVPDIIRAAVHRRIQVLRETLAGIEAEAAEAQCASDRFGESLAEYLAGISTDSEIPKSIDVLLAGLNEVGIDNHVSWTWDPKDEDDDLPELITVHMERNGRSYDRPPAKGLQKGTEFVVSLGPVSDATAAKFREDHALARVAADLKAKANDIRNELARPDMAREMEGEMLASMIEAQAPEISARIEELAMGRRLIGVAAS